MPLSDLLQALGEEIQEPEEECFLLFSREMPSQNLGFVDPSATALELTVGGQELSIRQSPTLLASNRTDGTTGAVVWKISPWVAAWIASADNIFFQTRTLDAASTVLELGCGVSGIVALALAPRIRTYIATDQDYVFKLLSANIASNTPEPKPAQMGKKKKGKPAAQEPKPPATNIKILPLDWISTQISSLRPLLAPSPAQEPSLDMILACDCIYNEALISAFVRACIDLCLLPHPSLPPQQKQTLCVIAQQLRSPTVFEAWLDAFHARFRVWRVPEGLLAEGSGGTGFVVHVGVLRDAGGEG